MEAAREQRSSLHRRRRELLIECTRRSRSKKSTKKGKGQMQNRQAQTPEQLELRRATRRQSDRQSRHD